MLIKKYMNFMSILPPENQVSITRDYFNGTLLRCKFTQSSGLIADFIANNFTQSISATMLYKYNNYITLISAVRLDQM